LNHMSKSSRDWTNIPSDLLALHIRDELIADRRRRNEPNLLVDSDGPLGRRVFRLARTVEFLLERACVRRLLRQNRKDKTDTIHDAPPLRGLGPNLLPNVGLPANRRKVLPASDVHRSVWDRVGITGRPESRVGGLRPEAGAAGGRSIS
jgi:hypothetical protein